jgi:hypothetical protein
MKNCLHPKNRWKVKHPSWEAAEKAVEFLEKKGEKTFIYQCGDHYHVGHLVANGVFQTRLDRIFYQLEKQK